MPLNKAKGRMFQSVGWTWTPVRGCSHGCGVSPENPRGYCWAASLARQRGEDFTKPILVEKDLQIKFPGDGSWVFVCSTGDLFCEAVPDEWIEAVLSSINRAVGNRFLLQTKNTPRLYDYKDRLTRLNYAPSRVVLGTTIETNRDVPGYAPPTAAREIFLREFKDLGFTTFLSMEPLAAFDHDVMVQWVENIQPEAIEVGLENYSSCLPKPSIPEVQRLYDSLTDRGFHVVLKDNLVGKIKEASA